MRDPGADPMALLEEKQALLEAKRAAAGISRMSASLSAGKITRRIPSVVCVAFNSINLIVHEAIALSKDRRNGHCHETSGH